MLSQNEGPGGVTTSLELWLKADEGVEEAAADAAEDGDSVLNWLDNTINTNDAAQATGSINQHIMKQLLTSILRLPLMVLTMK